MSKLVLSRVAFSIINDKSKYKELSVNATQFAEKFDIANYCKKLIKFYDTILTENIEKTSWGKATEA